MGTGGGFKSSTIVNYLRQKLTESGRVQHVYCSEEVNPVARGGLMQQPINEPDKLPPGRWWISRPREWSIDKPKDASTYANLYVDAAGTKHSKFAKGRKHNGHWETLPRKDRTFVLNDNGKETLYVPDRLAQLMEINPDSFSQTWPVPMMFYIKTNGSTTKLALEFKLYFSSWAVKRRELRQNGPLRNGKGLIYPDLEEWPIKIVDLPDLAAHGFSIIQSSDTLGHYELHAFVKLQIDLGVLILCIDVLSPDNCFQEAREGECEEVNPNGDYNFAFKLRDELWEENRSYRVVRTPASTQISSSQRCKRAQRQLPHHHQSSLDGESRLPLRRSKRQSDRRAPSIVRPDQGTSTRPILVADECPLAGSSSIDRDRDDDEPEPVCKRQRYSQ